MYAQQRLRSDCTDVQSDQSPCCLHGNAFDAWFPTECPVKTLIKLYTCNIAGNAVAQLIYDGKTAGAM